MPEIFDTAEDAWTYLVSHGGLDIGGRDALLVEQLIDRLTLGVGMDPAEGVREPELGDVLKRVSIEQLVNAMFGAVRPYIGMMRDLFDHFAKAGITEGPGQWKLALTSETDRLEIDFEHFKKFTKASETGIIPFEVPVLKQEQFWNLWEAFLEEEVRIPIGDRPSTDDTDSAPWDSRPKESAWLPLPAVVSRMMQRSDGLRDVAALIFETASAVQSCVPNYETLYHDISARVRGAPDNARVYLSIEHDKWIETMVRNLAAFEIALSLEQSKIIDKLNKRLTDVKRKPAEFVVSFEDLKAFLDLPIWKKRYELYSAWIFTQFLAAMHGHDIELHSEDGKLTFGFHATKFATVHSLRQPVSIYGERRVLATELKGHGRKAGIQPDYTVWVDGTDLCQMAIECKHYKRPSTSNFVNALDDYARNLPLARVFLGNYGPISITLKLETRHGGSTKRQFAWGNLNPDNPEEVKDFQNKIRSVFGEPVFSQKVKDQPGLIRVLAFDVSRSMHTVLENKDIRNEITELMSELAITHFAAVDDQLLALEKADIARIDWFIAQSRANRTELKAAAESLKGSAIEVYFLTDREGLSTLGPSAQNMWRYISQFDHLSRQSAVLARVEK